MEDLWTFRMYNNILYYVPTYKPEIDLVFLAGWFAETLSKPYPIGDSVHDIIYVTSRIE